MIASSRLPLALRGFFAAIALIPAAFASPKVFVVLKGRSAFWNAMEKGALAAGAETGAEVVVKAPLADTDVSVQIQLLNAVAAQGAEAIVIAPINKEALAVPIASIAIRGVKIVTVDTPLSGKAAPVFIGTDQEAAGKVAGKLLAQLVDPSREAAILRHNQSSGATLQREAGALAAFREVHPQIALHADIYSGSEPGHEEAKCRLLLQTHPNISVVLASSSTATLAMLKVLQEKKLTGSVKLIGFGFNLNPDVAAALEAGEMHGWIAQLPSEMGAKGVHSAVALLKGEEVPSVVHTDVFVVTKDNLNDPGVQALLSL